jgi:hypothetical protein
MEVYVTSDFVVDGPNPEEIMGAAVRIDELEGSGFGVAIHFLPAIQQAQRLGKCVGVRNVRLAGVNQSPLRNCDC